MSDSLFPLGRLVPQDWEHIELYPFSAVAPATVATVERNLTLPGWKNTHNQGQEGSCVGHAIAMERAITNRAQAVKTGDKRTVRYDPIDVWRQAKAVDEWPYTKPEDDNGTSVRAGYQVARTRGMCPVTSMKLVDGKPTPVGAKQPSVAAGVDTYRWAQTVDEIRTAIAAGLAVALGIRWYRGFDTPEKRSDGFFWLPTPGAKLGKVRGGHAIPVTGASDKRQAVRLTNSWGPAYPPVLLPYTMLEELVVKQDGEAALVTDR